MGIKVPVPAPVSTPWDRCSAGLVSPSPGGARYCGALLVAGDIQYLGVVTQHYVKTYFVDVGQFYGEMYLDTFSCPTLVRNMVTAHHRLCTGPVMGQGVMWDRWRLHIDEGLLRM